MRFVITILLLVVAVCVMLLFANQETLLNPVAPAVQQPAVQVQAPVVAPDAGSSTGVQVDVYACGSDENCNPAKPVDGGRSTRPDSGWKGPDDNP